MQELAIHTSQQFTQALSANFELLLRNASSESIMSLTGKTLQFFADKIHLFRGVCYVFNKQSERFHAEALYACELENGMAETYEMGEGLIGQAAERQKAIYFENISNHIQGVEFSGLKIKTSSFYIFPIIFNNKCYGVLELMFLAPIKKAIKEFFENAIGSLGATLESVISNEANKQLLLQTKVQNVEIEKAYKNIRVISIIGQKITAILDLESLVMEVFEQLQALMTVSALGIAEFRREVGFFNMNACVVNSELTSLGRFDLGDSSVLDHIFRSLDGAIFANAPSELPRIERNPIFKNPNMPSEYMASALFIPLTIDKKMKGVFTVQSTQKNFFKEKHINIVKTLASYISIAMENIDAFQMISDQNQAITASIRYAQQIQNAILPNNETMDLFFPEHFEIYIPKDMVSGDYYWLGESEGYRFLAVVDCTGHGVPGAFMSMIGNTALNQIILERKEIDCAEVLKQLSLYIENTLQQNTSKNTDGMDLMICRMKREGEKVDIQMAGAKSKAYIIKQNELYKVNGDNESIGGLIFKERRYKKFTNYAITLEKGDQVYMLTDGYTDVCNSDRKRLGRKRFEQSLLKFYQKPMSEQRELFRKEMNDFGKGAEQRDDITLVGIQF